MISPPLSIETRIKHFCTHNRRRHHYPSVGSAHNSATPTRRVSTRSQPSTPTLRETKPCSLQDTLFWQGYAIPLHNTLTVPKPPAGSPEPVRAPGPLDPSTLPESETLRVRLQTLRAMFTGPRCLPLSPSFSPPTFLTPYFVMSLVRSRCLALPHAARRVPHRTRRTPTKAAGAVLPRLTGAVHAGHRRQLSA